MFRRSFRQALAVWLACAGLVLPGRATTEEGKAPIGPPIHPLQPDDGAASKGGAKEATSQLQYRITRRTVENGLPQNSIKALAQTRDGYLWLGTLKGLVRFDGVRFKVFDHNNTPEMTHDSINDLAVDEQDGGLWIATGSGLLYYRDHQFERYGQKGSLADPVGTLSPAREGGVWFSSRYGEVGLARQERITTHEIGASVEQNAVRQLVEDSSSRLMLLLGSITSTLHEFDPATGSLRTLTNHQGKSECISMFPAPDGSLWFSMAGSLWQVRETNWTLVSSQTAIHGQYPERVYQRGNGPLWVVQVLNSSTSLYQWEKGSLRGVPEFPTDLQITHLLEDGEGGLWVGSTAGLLRLDPKRVRVYSRQEGLRSDNTLAVAKGPDGTIWVGTRDGPHRIKEGQANPLPRPSYIPGWPGVEVLLVDHTGALWIELAGRLARFYRDSWEEPLATLEPADIGEIRALYEDRDGHIWVANTRGLFCQEGGKWSDFSTRDGLSSRDVRVIYQDRRGALWFGTYGGGLNRLRNGKFTTYKTGRGEFNNRAWWIHEDADGVFWVGSEDGLNRFVPPGVEQTRNPKSETRNSQGLLPSAATGENENCFFTFTTQQGLGENVVNNIQEDDFGYLWLSGLRGVYRISRQELNEVAAGKRAQVQCVAYGTGDGMLNSECNGGDNQPAGCKDDEGRIWFPTAQGVVAIDPREMQRTESPPPVVIEQFRANGRVIFGDDVGDPSSLGLGRNAESNTVGTTNDGPQTNSYRKERQAPAAKTVHDLPAGSARVVEIRYTANSFAAPEHIRFKYRLEGYDADWLEDDQNRRVAFYTNLRPGRYTFHVTACNAHGFWNEIGAQFAFVVAPHFWETWAWYGACGAFLLFAGPALHYRRLQRLRRMQRLEQQRALQEERARIARDLHDDLGANLTGLALQLDVICGQSGSGDGRQGQLAVLANRTRGMVDNMREVVWAMNPQHDNVESLASFLGQYTENYLAGAGMRCRLEFPSYLPPRPLSSHIRHQLFLVVKEALHNVVRHARATEVRLRLEQDAQELRLALEDNGCGLPTQDAQIPERGLRNMKQRVADLGGTFSATNGPEQGTRIVITLPCGRSALSNPPA